MCNLHKINFWYIKSIQTTDLFLTLNLTLNDYLYGMYCIFVFSFTLQLQFKPIANSLNNNFYLKQFIHVSSLEMVQSSTSTTNPFFLPSLSFSSSKGNSTTSITYLLPSSSSLLQFCTIIHHLSTSSFLLSPSAVGRWYRPQLHCSRPGCWSPSRIYPVITKNNKLVMIMHLWTIIYQEYR